MKNNQLGKLVKYSKNDVSEIFLPNLQKKVYYDNKSDLEKNWLIKVDKSPGIKDVVRSELVLNYVDELGEISNYYPDYEVYWETGVKWLVEIKGVATDKDYIKISQASKWAK
jgi:hypothetical protein